MKTFAIWLLQVSVPISFAICLLVIFPPLLDSKLLVILSRCLGAFFLLMACLVTFGYLRIPRQKKDEDEGQIK